jgi:hypothetical protein
VPYLRSETGPTEDVAISANAALAWLRPTGSGSYELWATILEPKGIRGFRASPTMIDAGKIAPNTLRFIKGRALSATNNGTVNEKTLT